MKRTLHERAHRWLIALLSLGFLTAAAASHGAAITWAPTTNIASDSDVLNAGTLVYAYTWSGIASTVNGVSFTGSAHINGETNVLAPAFSNYGPAYFTSKAAPFSALSTAYSNILIGADYVVRLPVPVTLENLTIGHNYTVQVWVNDPRGPENARSETITSAGGNTNSLRFSINYTNTNPGGSGQYTIGTFTADATNQTFTLNGGTNVAQMNALQLRDETGFIKGGQTWTFGFQSLALVANQMPYRPGDVGTGSVLFYLTPGGPATVTVDLFENTLSDPPLTFPLTVTANQGLLNVLTTGIWGDHQGWVRLHVDTGEVKVSWVVISHTDYGGGPFESFYQYAFRTEQPVLSNVLLTNSSGILHFTLQWPAAVAMIGFNESSCTLQSSLSCGSGSWSDVTNQPVVVGTLSSVTVDAVGPQRFYRLINTNFTEMLQ